MKLLVAFVVGLIAAPLLFALAAIAGRLPSDAVSGPPQWESSVGMRALDASRERRSKSLKNPVGANDGDAVAAGQKLYANNCSGCHGSRLEPSNWGSHGFYPRVPQFWQEGSDITAEEAYVAVHDGIRYSGMGAWRDLMKQDDIWKVANFVAHIERLRSVGPTAAKPSR